MAGTTDVRSGAAHLVASSLFFSAMGAFVKALQVRLPHEEVVLFRNLLGLLFLVPWLLAPGGTARGRITTRRLGDHAGRALAGLAAMYCFFFALGRLPLAAALLLNYTVPLFIPFVARARLGERVSRRTWAAVVVGFAGVALVLHPDTGAFRPAALVGLLSGLFAAAAMVSIRDLSATEPEPRIVFYFALFGTLIAAPLAAPRFVAPDAGEWAGLFLLAALATAGQLTLTRGYALAPAGRIGAFVYTAVVFGAGIDGAVWGIAPDLRTAAGAGLVVAAGAIVWRGP